MASGAARPEKDGISAGGTPTPDVLKPKTAKAKVEKTKAEPKAKAKTERAAKSEKAAKAKSEKGDKVDGAGKIERVVKPKAEKADKKENSDGKTGEKKGEKVKPVTGDEAISLIVEYLKAQNRPFSATEVSANLHGKVTKTAADKILKELGENETLCMHSTNKFERGSQFVFWTPQDPADAASPEELATMDSTITALQSSSQSLRSSIKSLTMKLGVLKSAPITAELQTMVDALRVQNASKIEKLAGFKCGTVKQFSKEEMAAVEKAFKYWGRTRHARKNAYETLEEMFLGFTGKEKGECREEFGVEVD